MLTFLGIADRYRPKWIVWENVPGVLSSNRGKDFGSFLGALGELGYGWAYRVLDAQWFGVAQIRIRLIVVGCLGDQRRAAAVLFESESVSRNPAPSREKGQRVAASVAQCFAGSRQSDVAATLETTAHDYSRADGFNMVAQVFKVRGGVEREDGSRGSTNIGKQAGKGPLISEEKSLTLATSNDQVLAFRDPSPTITSKMQGASGWAPYNEDAHLVGVQPTSNDQVLSQPVAFDTYNQTINQHTSQTLGSSASDVNHYGAVLQPNISPTITQCKGSRGGSSMEALDEVSAIYAQQPTMAVRRLTPVECERLQGFPDNFTRIPWKKKPAEECPDGPRYKALGNSMAVPCMRWIGERIDKL